MGRISENLRFLALAAVAGSAVRYFRDVSQLAAGPLPHIYVFSIEIMKIVVFFCGAF